MFNDIGLALRQLAAAKDPSIIGAAFIIDGAPFTVIGIAPGFFGAALRPDPPDFWMPLATEPAAHAKNALMDQKPSHWIGAKWEPAGKDLKREFKYYWLSSRREGSTSL